MVASLEQRRARAREWIAQWEENYRRQNQLDAEADQRAFVLGLVDDPGPLQTSRRTQSSTNRTSSP